MMADFGPATRASRIDLAETPDFDLGGLRVSPARREVAMGDERRELEPRVAQVLVALASARPKVLSRDRLIEQCWDGRVVGDDALNRCIVALRHLAKEFSPEPFLIKTVPRVGYTLTEHGVSAATAGNHRHRMRLAVIVLLLVIFVGAALAVTWSRFGGAQNAPASIALLPFRNLSSGDPYFAEGIGEEILGQLSREPQFRVAGRSSSREFGPDADAREVARRLNVEYVVEGSVRKQGDRVRVNADLVRASDGSRLWSDSFDGKLDDIFAIQQQIGGAVAGALRRRLVRTPALSGPLVTNGEAYNLYLTARGLIRTRNKDVFVTSSNLLRDAIKLDPNYAPAWASLAESTYLVDYPRRQRRVDRALCRARTITRATRCNWRPTWQRATASWPCCCPTALPKHCRITGAPSSSTRTARRRCSGSVPRSALPASSTRNGGLPAGPRARPLMVQDHRTAGNPAGGNGATRGGRSGRTAGLRAQRKQS